MHNYTYITGLSNYLIYYASPLLDCTADKKATALVRCCGRISSQMPVRQASSRPMLEVRDCVPTWGSSSLYAPAFATKAEREGWRERKLPFIARIFWQIA